MTSTLRQAPQLPGALAVHLGARIPDPVHALVTLPVRFVSDEEAPPVLAANATGDRESSSDHRRASAAVSPNPVVLVDVALSIRRDLGRLDFSRIGHGHETKPIFARKVRCGRDVERYLYPTGIAVG